MAAEWSLLALQLGNYVRAGRKVCNALERCQRDGLTAAIGIAACPSDQTTCGHINTHQHGIPLS